jgi:type IV pilus assembly protein PilC
MSTFEYVAWDGSGNCREGVRQASSEDEVLSYLRQELLTPVSVREIAGVPKQKKKAAVRYRRVKSADLSTFCWQLSTMLSGGLGITTAIETIAEEIQNEYFSKVLQEIAAGLEQGRSMTECVQDHPKVFNKLSAAMIMAGDTSGSLTESLQRLADYYESKDKLSRKMKGALAYPIFVVSFIMVVITVLMTLIIPRFATMFKEFNGTLPVFTRAFMTFYHVIMSHSPFIIAGLVLSIFAILLYGKTPTGHRNLCRISLQLPLLGKIQLMAFVATFCKTLSTLISAGVPLLDAFQILAGMTNNDLMRQGVLDTREKMEAGVSISTSMEEVGFFPGVAVKMAQIGENSGSLSSVLQKTSEYYEKKVDSLVSMMLGILEPALIIIVGGIVLVVILAMYLPIFSMSV